MDNKEGRHWYAVTVISGGFGRNVMVNGVNIGFRERRITKAKLEHIIKSSPEGEGAIMSMSYLGFMTRDEFEAPLPEDW